MVAPSRAAPKRPIIAGIGLASGVSAAEILALIASCLAEAGYTASDLSGLATLDSRASESGLLEAAAALNLPVRGFSAAELAREAPRLTAMSDFVLETTGAPAIAEAAALAAGRLILPKRKSARATCALGGP